MKKFFRVLLTCLVLMNFQAVNAEDAFQDFYKHCTYGVVTGVLIGGVSLALSEDPGSNLSPITKGASLGLYAGALVSVYKNWYVTRRARIDIGESERKDKNTPDFIIIPKSQGLAFAFDWRI